MPLSRTSTESFLRRIWRQRGAAALLLPIALCFTLLSAARRTLYRLGIFKSRRLPVPVVVIGNITVGGSGKTPLILHLAQSLSQSGYLAGIVSRGYGSDEADAREVFANSDASRVGDEALLLKRRCGLPVFVGHDRFAAGSALLAAYPHCQLILCDDGLQHYRLWRDVEIAVLDRRGLMNGWMLPAGPLREPVSRLAEVDACVLNETSVAIRAEVATFRMRLEGNRFLLLGDPAQTASSAALAGLRLHAVAGIGEPQRFFDHLRALGLVFSAHAFADHHRYTVGDFDVDADAILTTEKDAVKCAGLTTLPIWVLPVDAVVEPDLARFILEKINGSAPA